MINSNFIHIKKDFKYVVKERLYHNGSGEGETEFVTATETATGRVVGIKKIRCSQKNYNAYKGEIAVIMGLEPYVADIPTIYYHDYENGVLTVAMQYFKGDTLFEVMKREKNTIQEVSTVNRNIKRLQALASILASVHRNKIQHKD